jgi:hypothetical protein
VPFCSPKFHYVIDSTDVIPNGMEEVIGSIPIRSTNQTPFLTVTCRPQRGAFCVSESAEGC